MGLQVAGNAQTKGSALAKRGHSTKIQQRKNSSSSSAVLLYHVQRREEERY